MLVPARAAAGRWAFRGMRGLCREIFSQMDPFLFASGSFSLWPPPFLLLHSKQRLGPYCLRERRRRLEDRQYTRARVTTPPRRSSAGSRSETLRELRGERRAPTRTSVSPFRNPQTQHAITPRPSSSFPRLCACARVLFSYTNAYVCTHARMAVSCVYVRVRMHVHMCASVRVCTCVHMWGGAAVSPGPSP